MPQNLPEIQAGTTIAGVPMLVVEVRPATTKAGKPYLNLKLRDSGQKEIEARIWADNEALFPLFASGKVVEVGGNLEEYNGKVSLVVKGAVASAISAGEFVRSTHLDVGEMWQDLRQRVAQMAEPVTKAIAEAIMARPGFEQGFRTSPAARTMHNNWRGGLLEHVHSLCRLADAVVPHYRQLYGCDISMDKVLFGLIFHDAGKMHEYDPASPTFDVSLIGYLTPHIVLGPAWVYEAARQLPPELAANRLEIAHLMHLLAAHHGQEEWGSPVRPASLEALIVHHLDNLDSKVMHALELATHKPGPVQGMSERSFAERTPYLKVPPITPSNAW